MALPTTLEPSLTPQELTFISEQQEIEIVPSFSMTKIRLVSILNAMVAEEMNEKNGLWPDIPRYLFETAKVLLDVPGRENEEEPDTGAFSGRGEYMSLTGFTPLEVAQMRGMFTGVLGVVGKLSGGVDVVDPREEGADAVGGFGAAAEEEEDDMDMDMR
ncbi:hypothetical protein QFC22_005981 [Naganishia vaughanmartiniae]|uniref:Uncharacterized protein n=1 Tax=Naganishia vaughanmartiniae TaxID=1424756 RepID=A0ACC2WT17_9TREE|nr:hypothetical protein QFC22_005981 [Naganishia vaughanmartiniae]